VSTVVALPEELGRLRRLAGGYPATRWDRLLFCAEEAVDKAWSPLTGGVVGRLLPGPDLDGAPRGFTGRWLARDGLL
jgi:hypothetical protein